MWSWPTGNVAVILFAILFYQIQLYSDFAEQGYFLVTGFYGWWAWSTIRAKDAAKSVTRFVVSRNTPRANALWLAVVVALTVALAFIASRLHIVLPNLFPEPASFPVLDAFTTAMSFVANLLLARRRIECWPLWITVDVIGMGLYFAKGVLFVALLYGIFLVIATRGWFTWRRILRTTEAAA